MSYYIPTSNAPQAIPTFQAFFELVFRLPKELRPSIRSYHQGVFDGKLISFPTFRVTAADIRAHFQLGDEDIRLGHEIDLHSIGGGMTREVLKVDPTFATVVFADEADAVAFKLRHADEIDFVEEGA